MDHTNDYWSGLYVRVVFFLSVAAPVILRLVSEWRPFQRG